MKINKFRISVQVNVQAWRFFAIFFATITAVLSLGLFRRSTEVEIVSPQKTIEVGASAVPLKPTGKLSSEPNKGDEARSKAEIPIARSLESIVGKTDPNRGIIADADRALRQPINFRRISQQRVEQSYGIWIDSVNIDPQKRTQLKKLLVTRIDMVGDAQTAMARQKIDDPATISSSIAQVTSGVDSEIAQLVAPEDFEVFKDFLSVEKEYSLYSTQFLPDFAFADVPLSVSQVIYLMKTLAAVRTMYPSGAPEAKIVASVEGFKIPENEALNRASTFLNPEQLDVLKDFFRSRYEIANEPMILHRGATH